MRDVSDSEPDEAVALEELRRARGRLAWAERVGNGEAATIARSVIRANLRALGLQSGVVRPAHAMRTT